MRNTQRRIALNTRERAIESYREKPFGTLVSCLLAMALLSLPTWAQEADGDEDEDEEMEDLIVVGTSIKNAQIDKPYATTNLYRDGMRDQGSPLMVDLFKNLSASFGVMGERQAWYNHSQANTVPENVTTVNLRGLGPSRTLVLLNGKRQVYVPAQIFGGRFVDVSNFPSIALDGIQVLKEGAAAIYGSEAVAGVVDFRTRSDFEGFQVAVNLEQFADAGDATVGAIWGRDFEDFSLVASYERGQRSALRPPDRSDYVLRPFSGDGGWSFWGNPGAYIVPSEPLPTDVEGFIGALQGIPHMIDPECENFGGHVEDFANYPEFNTCRFRYAPWDSIIEGMVHDRVFVELNGTVGESTDWHLELLWSKANIDDWLTTPSYPPRSQFDGIQYVGPDHPGRISFCDTYGDVIPECANTQDWYFYGRFRGNGGPGRYLERNSDTLRIAGSISDEFTWGRLTPTYELAFSYSTANGYIESGGEYAYRKFLAFRGYGGPSCGVGVVADSNSPSGMSIGNIPAGVSPGSGNCYYYNPFSNALERAEQPGTRYTNQSNPNYDPSVANNSAMMDWVYEVLGQDSTATLLVGDAIFSGSFIPEVLEYAAGFQVRRFSVESSANDPGNLSINPCFIPGSRDCAGQTGLFTFTVGTFPYESDQLAFRTYGELAISAGERTLIQVALTHEDYEIASTVDPKVAIRFDVNEFLSVRSSIQTTFRTPSADDVNDHPLTTLEYVAEADIYKAIETYGSSNLDPESAFTYNIGIIGQANDFEYTFDYWSYRFKDIIGPLPHSAVSRLYVNDATRPLVQHLVTCPGGIHPCSGISIERIRVDLVNWPGVDTTGFDFYASKSWFTDYGQVTWRVDGTHVNTYSVKALYAFDEVLVAEEEGAGFLNQPSPIAPPIPQLKMRTSASLDREPYRFVTYLNYVGSYEDQTEAGSQYGEIDSYVTLDVNFNWTLEEWRMNLNFGILNLLDTDPPLVNWEQGYDGFTHDPKGRRLKAVVSYDFPN